MCTNCEWLGNGKCIAPKRCNKDDGQTTIQQVIQFPKDIPRSKDNEADARQKLNEASRRVF